VVVIVGALTAIATGVTATSAAAVGRPATTNQVTPPAVATGQPTTLAQSGQNSGGTTGGGTDIPLDLEAGGTLVVAGTAIGTLLAEARNRRLVETRNWVRRAVEALDQAKSYEKVGFNELGPSGLGARAAELSGLAGNFAKLRSDLALLPTRRTLAHPIAGPDRDARQEDTVDANLGRVGSAAGALAVSIGDAAIWKERALTSGLTQAQRVVLEEALGNSMEGREELVAAAEAAFGAINDYVRQVLRLRGVPGLEQERPAAPAALTSKRTAVFAVAPALVIGGVIGFAWPAPGHPTTWTDIRTWVCFAVATIGVTIAIILDGQLREFESL
jgi:hypothetical protein